MFQFLDDPDRQIVHCYNTDSDVHVASHLAVSPAEMLDMTNRGLSISTASADAFYDGDTSTSFDVPPEYKRGFDAVAAYELQTKSRYKVREMYSKLSNYIEK